jgi:hypothetical protein
VEQKGLFPPFRHCGGAIRNGKTKKAFGWCEITTSKRRQNTFPPRFPAGAFLQPDVSRSFSSEANASHFIPEGVGR